MRLKLKKTYLTIALSLFHIEIAIALFLKTGFIRHTFGDFLVVILLYAIFRGLTDLSVRASSLVVLLIAYGIEFLQLTTFLAYFNLQDSYTAKLIFGSTFQVTDLVAYTLGITTTFLIEYYYANHKNTHTVKI